MTISTEELLAYRTLMESVSPTSGVVARTAYINKSKLALEHLIAEVERLRDVLGCCWKQYDELVVIVRRKNDEIAAKDAEIARLKEERIGR